MKVALVTTAPSIRSGIGDYTRHLLPELLAHCDVSLFVAPGTEGESLLSLRTRSAADLLPREFDHVLYQLGNETSHAFMARMVRALGGTVVQHDWVLFDLALAAYPALGRGGAKGLALALREGGVDQARIYLRNVRDRRRERRERATSPPGPAPEGTLLFGWHAPEPAGRWTSDVAHFRLPSQACARVRVSLSSEPERAIALRGPRGESATGVCDGSAMELALELDGAAEPELALEIAGIVASADQRRRGDTRRLGAFVRKIEFDDERGTHALDLAARVSSPLRTVHLSRDRFALPLNRSIVRFGDAFIVHSDHVRRRILEERNAPTPIGVVHHGAERRWRDEDRRIERDRLGLRDEWRDAFLVTCFGAVQPHKRVDRLLEALALARRTHPKLRLALIGRLETEEFDVEECVRRLGLDDAVRIAGHVREEEAWSRIHAGDLAVQLRGPSTGGSSGGVFQSLSLGRAVIASDLGEQRELPASCVLKVAPGEGEVAALARLMAELCDDPLRRGELERGAREFVERECSWHRVAASYADMLANFPAPRSARKSLFAMRVRRAVRERRA